MRRLILIILLGAAGQCYAGTVEMDTIDNWQIYNGNEFVFGGHDSPIGTEFQGTIKTTDFKELVIQFNHCVRFIDDYNVTLEVMDDKGKNILLKKFKANLGTRMTIDKKELGPLTMKAITIRYREQRKNGTDKILGRISFV
ncbi:MAG: hypothetical protein IM606_08985 [Cytophagales bacterium]|jgi:hypothetical protein|nr:hypothetical protein [Cytophagales bacterium]MCA6387973.1 hypothetical protein [Cytophagales bacterium]MCA6393021.1 hypothetical protein [Cytophagales bacterium]MCA6395310.1 hypothetical protein [Cytophagales bacterium]MCA6415316.1 hypothetical protein [Cytophagales bacterium]